MVENDISEKNIARLISSAGLEVHIPAARKTEIVERLTSNAATSVRTQEQKSMWRGIMKSRITKLAAAAVIIISIAIGIDYFGGPIHGAGVAFGEVLGYVQTSSYTFDLTVKTVPPDGGLTPLTMQAMVWELGRMRVDCTTGTVGKISSITNFNTGKTLLLFHQNKTGVIKQESVLNQNTGAGGIVSFCAKPIENLWNLRDDTEEQLGEKVAQGQIITGFRVFQEDQYFQYNITIWADSKSGVPSLVEVTAKPLDASYTSVKWTMNNFDLDVELDEKSFSLEVPAGYTLAYQSDLDSPKLQTEPSAESQKVLQMLELWSEGKRSEAVQVLLGINWTGPIEFGKEPYLFSLTEKGYVSLKAEDQRRVMDEIMTTATTVRKIVHEVLSIGQAAVAAQDYERAEGHLEAVLQLGKLLARDPESMIIVRLLGIAIQKRGLNEMINLYSTLNDQEKLQAAKSHLEAAEVEGDKIKKEAMGL
jgi:hypothetical protein